MHPPTREMQLVGSFTNAHSGNTIKQIGWNLPTGPR
jgi:hypothetical protein